MKIAYLILAAGRASRFGAPKQLARLPSGQSIIEHAISQAPAVLRAHTYVVVGAYRDQVLPLLGEAQAIVHENWADGLGSSLSFGVKQVVAQTSYDAILVGLADQVAVLSRDLGRLLDAYAPDHIVCARYGGQCGVPALFPRAKFSELMALQGDQGAKKLLSNAQSKRLEIDLNAAELDIDTPDDLRAFERDLFSKEDGR